MDNDITNRMATTRKRGRPPISDRQPAAEPTEAVPVLLSIRHVPPINCPCCGRGMVPKVARWVGAVANCTCGLCGKRFDYTPPLVRPIAG